MKLKLKPKMLLHSKILATTDDVFFTVHFTACVFTVYSRSKNVLWTLNHVYVV